MRQASVPADFLDRLKEAAGAREFDAWLVGVGWTRQDAIRVRTEGHIPGPSKLVMLAIRENLSLSWLLAGIGPSHVGQGGWMAMEPRPAHLDMSPAWLRLRQLLDGAPDSVIDAIYDMVKALRF